MSKYITKLEDLESGIYIVRQQDDSEHIKDTGYLSTIMYKLGYINHPRLVTRTSMSDGWTYTYDNKEEMLTALKNQNYRLATKEEVLRVINYQSNYISD